MSWEFLSSIKLIYARVPLCVLSSLLFLSGSTAYAIRKDCSLIAPLTQFLDDLSLATTPAILISFETPQELLDFLQLNIPNTISTFESDAGKERHHVGPLRYRWNQQILDGSLQIFRDHRRNKWMAAFREYVHAQNADGEESIERNHTVELNLLRFDPGDLLPTPATKITRPLSYAEAKATFRQIPPELAVTQTLPSIPSPPLGVPSPVVLAGVQRVVGNWTPGANETEILNASFSHGRKRFSTDPAEAGAYIALPNAFGRDSLAQIQKIWRSRDATGANTTQPMVDIWVINEPHARTISWERLLESKPDLAAQTLFNGQLRRAAAARSTFSTKPYPVQKRPAGNLNIDRARKFGEGTQAVDTNISTMQAFHQAGLEQNREFRIADGSDGNNVMPYAIHNGHFENPNLAMSQKTVTRVVSALREVQIYELIGGQHGFAPRVKGAGTPFTWILQDPQTVEMLQIAHRFGVRIIIDSTLHLNDAGGFWEPQNQFIRLPAMVSRTTLRHELQHAIFERSGLRAHLEGLLKDQQFAEAIRREDAYSQARALRIFNELITNNPEAFQGIIETAQAANMPLDRYFDLLHASVFMGLGTAPPPNPHPYFVINECMSVQSELYNMQLAGISETDPRYIRTLEYALEWQMTYLEGIPENQRLPIQHERLKYVRARLKIP